MHAPHHEPLSKTRESRLGLVRPHGAPKHITTTTQHMQKRKGRLRPSGAWGLHMQITVEADVRITNLAASKGVLTGR